MKINTKIFSVMVAAVLGVVCVYARPVSVANHSFEIPAIDPNENPNYAIGFISLWREIDGDPYGFGIGTFRNTPADNNDHIINPDGNQLVFVNSNGGNALEQELAAAYRVGRQYRLTVGVCPSLRYPPTASHSLLLAFRYLYSSWTMMDIPASPQPVLGSQLVQKQLLDFFLTLPTVKPTDPWVGKNIGIAFRTAGEAGKYWDLDNVRLTELGGDVTGDGFVNLIDFAQLAAQWLSCTNTTADLTGDGCVNLNDVLLMSEYWMDSL